jgi:hypothetical protein
MSISNKHNQSNAKSAEESISNRHLSSGKLPDYLQEQVNQATSPSHYSVVNNAGMSTGSFFQKKYNPWTNYSGLQVYDTEGDE